MTKLIQPLSTMIPIVDDDGKPTPQFARTLQTLAVSSNLSVTNGTIDVAAIAAHMILANKTAGSATPTACSISDILDFLTTTRGSILFRGVSGWQALTPGTANQVLQTNGPGADPTWATPASGGGVSVIGYPLLSATQTPGVNNYIMTFMVVDTAITVNKVAFAVNVATATSKLQAFVYASNAAGVAGALLGSSVQQTGVVAGYNEISLTAPVVLTKGTLIWIGVNVTVAALAGMWARPGGLSAFAGNGGSTVPANPSPAITTFTTANAIYALWGVT